MLQGKFLVVGTNKGKGSFEDRQTGKPIEWSNTKITVLEEFKQDDTKGYKASELKGEYGLFEKFNTIPGIYNLHMDLSNNRTKVVDVEFDRQVKF